MEIKDVTRKLLLLSGVCCLATMMAGCNSSFSDPFASRAVGQKFFVPPDPANQFPMTQYSETLVTRATLLKLSQKDDLGSSRSGFASLKTGQGVSLKSITLLGKDDAKDVYDMDRIKKLNDTKECGAIANDIKEIMLSYPDMILVCDVRFTNSFRTATSVSVTTEDGNAHEFTSWGSHFSEGAGYRVIIQSLTL